MWRVLTTLITVAQVEFLPVYVPNEEEKKDVKLYAANVRAFMADRIHKEMSDLGFEDCRLIQAGEISEHRQRRSFVLFSFVCFFLFLSKKGFKHAHLSMKHNLVKSIRKSEKSARNELTSSPVNCTSQRFAPSTGNCYD